MKHEFHVVNGSGECEALQQRLREGWLIISVTPQAVAAAGQDTIREPVRGRWLIVIEQRT